VPRTPGDASDDANVAGLFALLGLPAGDAVAISLGSFTLALWIVATGALAYGLHGATLTAGDRLVRPSDGDSNGSPPER
jgi:hypothetical protein